MDVTLIELFDDVAAIFDRVRADKARLDFSGDGDDGMVTFAHFVRESDGTILEFKRNGSEVEDVEDVEDESFQRLRSHESFDPETNEWIMTESLTSVAWSQLLVELASLVLDSKASGWECGSGAYGEIEIRREAVIVDVFRRIELPNDDGDSDWEEEHESYSVERPPAPPAPPTTHFPAAPAQQDEADEHGSERISGDPLQVTVTSWHECDVEEYGKDEDDEDVIVGYLRTLEIQADLTVRGTLVAVAKLGPELWLRPPSSDVFMECSDFFLQRDYGTPEELHALETASTLLRSCLTTEPTKSFPWWRALESLIADRMRAEPRTRGTFVHVLGDGHPRVCGWVSQTRTEIEGIDDEQRQLAERVVQALERSGGLSSLGIAKLLGPDMYGNVFVDRGPAAKPCFLVVSPDRDNVADRATYSPWLMQLIVTDIVSIELLRGGVNETAKRCNDYNRRTEFVRRYWDDRHVHITAHMTLPQTPNDDDAGTHARAAFARLLERITEEEKHLVEEFKTGISLYCYKVPWMAP